MLEIQSPAPKPTALYFRNIKRARLGQVRKALRQMFTHPWAVLGLSFLGQSVIEIVCHSGLCDQVVGKLRLIGATHIRNLDVFGDNLKKKTILKDAPARQTTNLEPAHSRFERLVSTCTNAAAKSWYRQQAEEAEKRLARIYQAAHDVETSVSEDSGYDSQDISNSTLADTPRPELTPMDVDNRDGAAASSEANTQPVTSVEEDEITPVPSRCDQAQEAPREQ